MKIPYRIYHVQSGYRNIILLIDRNTFPGDKSEYVLQSLRPNTPYVLRAASVNLVEPGEYTQNLTIKTGNGATFRYKLSAFVVILFLSLHSHRIFSVKLA